MNDAALWVVVLSAIGGTFLWRLAGVLIAERVDEKSPFFEWVTYMSFAIAAGLMMKLLVLPSGILAGTPLFNRVAGLGAAIAVFFLLKRRLLPALIVGLALFIILNVLPIRPFP